LHIADSRESEHNAKTTHNAIRDSPGIAYSRVGLFLPAPQAKAQPLAVQGDDFAVARLLVGTWRLQYGPYMIETVYQSDGHFSSITRNQFKAFYCEGSWEVRQGMLVQHYTSWYPRVRMPDAESTYVNFIDANRFLHKMGSAYHVN
jgi:hypothetical protein